jgi:hypothetical protein
LFEHRGYILRVSYNINQLLYLNFSIQIDEKNKDKFHYLLNYKAEFKIQLFNQIGLSNNQYLIKLLILVVI